MKSAIRQYFSKIGKRGGKAGKGIPKNVDPLLAKERARKALAARWAGHVKAEKSKTA
jgi:hypothetical protein